MRLEPLGLDMTWEVEQRHTGLKDLIREAPEQWQKPTTPGGAFAALQYGRFSLEHPEELWAPLREQFRERLPEVADFGERLVHAVKQHGWKTPGACLESLIAAREVLGLRPYATIEDRQRGQRL
jgi:hypothetical protein